ncbi:hypothetical protein R1flu_004133 [Riccia fluitans]|uniref:ZZ-type domain-containing protein n=1 Tax=Riccia fluitans TaxID=41844 RepID=A0ABD1YQE1_9MARC
MLERVAGVTVKTNHPTLVPQPPPRFVAIAHEPSISSGLMNFHNIATLNFVMAFIIKVENEGILRRLPYSMDETEGLSFDKLEAKVRDLLKLPGTARLKITYKDKENDDVTLSSDQELNDACRIQKLNPLRLKIVVVPSDKTTTEKSSVQEAEALQNTSSPEAYVKKIVECYAPVFNGVCPPEQISGVMDDIVKKVNAQVSASAVTEGADPSAATRHLTPQDWLRNLPAPNGARAVEKQDKAKAETSLDKDSSKKGTDEVIHRGVTCDICHQNPITGIRYKATKKLNYDLCGRCFEKSGRKGEYNRIDQPLQRPHWGTESVKMVRLSPATVIGVRDSCGPPKLVLAPRGGRCKSSETC